jgi:type III secretion protein V
LSNLPASQTAPEEQGKTSISQKLTKLLATNNDIILVFVLGMVVCLILFPFPDWLMDTLIAINLAISVGILLISTYIPAALNLSTFPSLLLVTTLFRLAISIATTKLILLNAHAGSIIETFGRVVVGGNLVVGIVVFSIIAIVQFIVITKGSERVAEVGARFSLDAMPGKQMSIDADLRAGFINAAQARARRGQLSQESMLHGGMDGAMKFVKGDAIASIIITVVNIVAGMAVGVMMKGMEASVALETYTILAIGDAMVAQLPSLFISIAAGMVITRVSNDHSEKSNLGTEMGRQLVSEPKALIVTGVIMLGFALFPGFPKIQFTLLAAMFIAGGYWLLRKTRRKHGTEIAQMDVLKSTSERNRDSLIAPPLAMYVTDKFENLLNSEILGEGIKKTRQNLAEDLGLPFPGVHVAFTPKLPPDIDYVIRIHDVPVAQGQLPIDQYFEPSNPDLMLQETWPLEGEWVSLPAKADKGDRLEPEIVICKHLAFVLRQNASKFLGTQDVQSLLKLIEPQLPDVVQEVTRGMPPQRVAEVFRRLVDENIPLRNMRQILDSLIVWGPKERDNVMLAECVRVDLSPQVTYLALKGATVARCIVLAPPLEEELRGAIQQSSNGNFLALSPEDTSALLDKFRAIYEAEFAKGLSAPIVLAPIDLRRYIRRMLEPLGNFVNVLSYQEIQPSVRLEPVAEIG